MRQECVFCRGSQRPGKRLPQALLQLLRLQEAPGLRVHHRARQQDVLQLLLQVSHGYQGDYNMEHVIGSIWLDIANVS